MVTDSCEEKASLKERLTLLPCKLLDSIDKAKFHLGVFSLVVVVVLVGLLLASSRDAVDSNPLRIWMNDVLRSEQLLGESRDLTSRQSDVSLIQYLSPEQHNVSILEREQLLKHLHLVKKLLQTSVRFRGIKWDYSSICSKIPFPYYQSSYYSAHMVNDLMADFNPCLMTTPLDCFWDGAALLDATTKPRLVYPVKRGFSASSDLSSMGFVDLNRRLKWTNANLRENITRLMAVYPSERTLSFIVNLLDQYGLGESSYTRKKCLDVSNCQPYAREMHSTEQIVSALSMFHSSCPSFAPKLHNSSLDITLGSVSRTADGRIMSGKQLQTVLHLKSASQFYTAARAQMRILHVEWDLDSAQHILALFYQKFKQVADDFNSAQSVLSQRAPSQFQLFSIRSLNYEQLALLEKPQLMALLCSAVLILAVLFISERFVLNYSMPLASSVSVFLVSCLFTAVIVLLPLLLNSKSVPLCGESVQTAMAIVIPIVITSLYAERMLLNQCVSTWKCSVSWPVFFCPLAILPPTLLSLLVYSIPVIRTVLVSVACLMLASPFVAILASRPTRLCLEAICAKCHRMKTSSQKSNLKSESETKLSSSEEMKCGRTSKSTSNRDRDYALNKWSGETKCKDEVSLLSREEDQSGEERTRGKLRSSPSPPSSSGNKVSLYELGIPQSYIRPQKRRNQRRGAGGGPHRRHEGHCRQKRQGLVGVELEMGVGVGVGVGGNSEDVVKASNESQNGDDRDGTQDKVAADYRETNAEHRTEPRSNSPPGSPREGNGEEEGQHHHLHPVHQSEERRTNTNRDYSSVGLVTVRERDKRRVARANRFHYNPSTLSSSSACCRYYYAHYCHTLRQSKLKKRKLKRLSVRIRPLEVINSFVFDTLTKWFNFSASKQYQITISCICLIACVLSCYLIPNAKTGLDSELDLIHRESSLFSFVQMMSNNFKLALKMSIGIYSKGSDLADPKIQRLLSNLDTEMREMSIVDSSSESSRCWLKQMRLFLSKSQLAYEQYKSKRGSMEEHDLNMTKEAQMGQVMVLQSGSPFLASGSNTHQLVDSDGIIFPNSFYSLLTAWHNWDIKGVFHAQPGFEPPPPPLPAFEPQVFVVTPAERVTLSFFHYRLNIFGLSSSQHLFSSLTELLRLCQRFSESSGGVVRLFPTGNILFAWSQFHHFSLLLFSVLMLTALTQPLSLYLLFRNSRLTVVTLMLNLCETLLVLAVCVSLWWVQLKLNPLSCLCCLAPLLSLSFLLSNSLLCFPATCPISDNHACLNLMHRSSDFYCKMLIVVSVGSASHILAAVPLFFSAYKIISRSVMVTSVAVAVVTLVTFVFVLPFLMSHLVRKRQLKAAQQQQHRCGSHSSSSRRHHDHAPSTPSRSSKHRHKLKLDNEHSLLPSGSSSDQSWHWFPYSSSWHGAASTLQTGSPRPPVGVVSQMTPPQVPPPRDSPAQIMYPLQVSTSGKRLGFFAGQGTLSRRQKLRLQKSYLKNQQFLAMAVAGQTSSRNSVSNASYSPRLPALSRSISASSQQGPNSSSYPYLMPFNGSNKTPHNSGTVTALFPSTGSSERKLFLQPQSPRPKEEHECCHALHLRGGGGAMNVEESSVSSFYPLSFTDAESDFLLMRSPSQNALTSHSVVTTTDINSFIK